MPRPALVKKLVIASLLSVLLVFLFPFLLSRRAPVPEPLLTLPAPRATSPLPGSEEAPPLRPVAESPPAGEPAASATLAGLVSVNGRPASGAEVRLLEPAALDTIAPEASTSPGPARLAELRARWLAARAAAQAVRSGADGLYRVDSARPGQWRVLVEHADAAASRMLPCVLQAGAETRLDCALAGGLRISGKVVTAGGAPAAGVAVRAEPSRYAAQGPLARGTAFLCAVDRGDLPAAPGASTNAQGEFLLRGLSDEAQVVEALAPDGSRGRLDGVPAGAAAVVVTLEPGGAVAGRVRRVGAGARVAAVLVTAASLARGARDEATLRASREPGDVTEGPFLASTAEDGAFRVSGLVEGAYRVCIEARGLRPFVSPPVDVPSNVEVRLGVIDLAEDKPIEGIVLARGGKGLPGVSVLAFASGVRGQDAPLGETVTNSQGRYSLTGLLGGLYDVEARSPEWAPARREEVSAGSQGVDFTLERGLTLRGTVMDLRSRAPLEGATLTAFPSQRAVSNASGVFTLSGLGPTVDRRGSPVSDRLVLTGSLPGYRNARLPIPWPPRPGAADLVVELEEALVIVGRVETIEGAPAPGARVRLVFPGVPDRLAHGEPALTAIADVGGEYRLVATAELELFRLGPRVRILAEDPASGAVGAREILEEAVADLEGGELRADVTLDSSASIAGNVTDPDGAPARGVEVRLVEPGPPGDATALAHAFGIVEALRVAVTDGSGRYAVRALPEGSYFLRAQSRLSAPLEKEITLSRGAAATVDLRLPKGRALTGIVREQDGRPIAGAEVLGWSDRFALVTIPRLRLLAEEGSGEARALADENGRFELSRLPEEPLLLVGRDADHETTYVRVPPETSTQELVLRPVVDVLGRIISASTEAPVIGCYANLDAVGADPEAQASDAWSLSPGARLWVSAQDGGFAFLRVPAGGPYRLRVESPEHQPYARGLEVKVGMEPLLVRLESGFTLSGAVVDAATFEPISGAKVRCSSRQETRGSGAQDRGAFEVKGLAAGQWSLRIDAAGFVGHARSISITKDTSLGTVALEPAGSLQLVIEGLPPGEVEVEAIATEPPYSARARLSAEGVFELDGLPAARYSVAVMADGYFTLNIGEVEIRAGRSLQHHVKFAGRRRMSHGDEP